MDKYTGFIGLGNIGAPMARNLLRTLGRLAVCNRSQEICRTFAAEGAEVCPAPGDLAERADIVFLALPGPAEVRQVAAFWSGAGRGCASWTAAPSPPA